MNDSGWTLRELLERFRALLPALPPPRDPRVRREPDLRVFRYYAARGLVDPPLAMRGRRGLYGQRHLRQLLAIRRLQAAGWTLDQIQARLAELGDAALADLAAAPTPRRQARPSETLRLQEGIELRIDGSAAISAAEARRLRRLSQPLLRRLRTLRSTQEEPERERTN